MDKIFIERIFNIDFKKKCYRKITVQSFKEDRKTCQWIWKNINRRKLETMMFTDEKNFHQKNGYFNGKNDVMWVDDRFDTKQDGRLHLIHCV